MHSHITHSPQSIRFRRWSRAGYAVFCSLACTVTIGALAIEMSDKSLLKTNRHSSSFLIPSSEQTEILLEEELNESESILAQASPFTCTTLDAAAAGCSNIYNIFNCHG